MKAIVRKDLISSLPLPNRLKDYLSYKNCYTEHFLEDGNGGEKLIGLIMEIKNNLKQIISRRRRSEIRRRRWYSVVEWQ